MKKSKKKDEYEMDEISEAPDDIVEETKTDSDISSDPDSLGSLGDASNEPEDDKVAELEEKLALSQEQLKRAVADYHNLEKRVSEGRAELANWANGELLRKIVPVMDHFDQALRGAQDAGESGGWLKGVEMATKELRKTLEESGLETVQVEQFDPTLHEAVEVVEGESGKILKVVEMGYTLNGKVLKPAKVVVGMEN